MASRYEEHLGRVARGEDQESAINEYLKEAYPDYLVVWGGDPTKPWAREQARIDFELYPNPTGKKATEFPDGEEGLYNYLKKQTLLHPNSHWPPVFVECKDRIPTGYPYNSTAHYVRQQALYEEMRKKYPTGIQRKALEEMEDYYGSADILIPEGKFSGDIHYYNTREKNVHPKVGRVDEALMKGQLRRTLVKDTESPEGVYLETVELTKKAVPEATIDGFKSILHKFPNAECYVIARMYADKAGGHMMELAVMYTPDHFSRYVSKIRKGKIAGVDNYEIPINLFAVLPLQQAVKLSTLFNSVHLPHPRYTAKKELYGDEDVPIEGLSQREFVAKDTTPAEWATKTKTERETKFGKDYNAPDIREEVERIRRMKEKNLKVLETAFAKGVSSKKIPRHTHRIVKERVVTDDNGDKYKVSRTGKPSWKLNETTGEYEQMIPLQTYKLNTATNKWEKRIISAKKYNKLFK